MDWIKFQLIVGALIRWGLGVLSGILIEQGALNQDSKTEFIATGAVFLLPLIWSVVQKFKQARAVDVALTLPSYSSHRQLDQALKNGRDL